MYDRKTYYYDPSDGYYDSGQVDGQTGGQEKDYRTAYDSVYPGGFDRTAAFESVAQDSHARSAAYGSEHGAPNSGMNSGKGKGGRPKKEKAKKTIEWTRGKLVALLLAVVLLAGGAGYGGSMLAGSGHGTQTSVSTDSGTAQDAGYSLESATGSKMTVQQISDAVSDSVVEIRTESVSQGMWIQEYVTEGAGSGVVISEDGYIITNNHVVAGANSIYVTLDDTDKEYTAKLVGTDSANDIAVLKIDAKGLTPAKFGNSDDVKAGDMAVVIGNPLGELGDSVSAGIISSTARKVTLENQEMTLMQTDASINPGNSGGGMFNSNGLLVGVVVAKSSGTGIEGLGFAIPINTVSKAVDDIMNGGGDDTSQQQEGSDQNSQDSQSGQDPWGDDSQDGQDEFGGGYDPFSLFDWFGF